VVPTQNRKDIAKTIVVRLNSQPSRLQSALARTVDSQPSTARSI
jgi:hypothetical protein